MLWFVDCYRADWLHVGGIWVRDSRHVCHAGAMEALHLAHLLRQQWGVDRIVVINHSGWPEWG